MHAVVVKLTIDDVDRDDQLLEQQVVPTASGAAGFVAGYWTRSSSDDKGLSMVVFETEDQANAAAAMIQQGPPNPDAVTLEGVEVREVIESA